MRKRIGYCAAVAALLLVGAGCEGSVRQDAAVGAPESGAAMMKKDDTAPPAEGDAGIDASVDALVGGADDERSAQDEKASDAEEIGADKDGLNAFGESSYEIK